MYTGVRLSAPPRVNAGNSTRLAQQVAAWGLTHNGMLYRDSMYTGMRPRVPSRVNAGNAATPRRQAERTTGTRVVLRPILYAWNCNRENLIDNLGEIYDVMNGSPWLYAIVSYTMSFSCKIASETYSNEL